MRGSSKLHAMLASMMSFAGFPFTNDMPASAGRRPKKFGRIRGRSGNKYKPAYSRGFRGLPRVAEPNRTKAPTLDQVRHLERKYGQRLIVKKGLIHFKTDGQVFSKAEAELRTAQEAPDACPGAA